MHAPEAHARARLAGRDGMLGDVLDAWVSHIVASGRGDDAIEDVREEAAHASGAAHCEDVDVLAGCTHSMSASDPASLLGIRGMALQEAAGRTLAPALLPAARCTVCAIECSAPSAACVQRSGRGCQ